MQILHLVPKNCLSSSDLRPDNKVSPDCAFQSSRRPRKGPRPNKITKASLLAGVGFALAMNCGQTGYCAPDVSGRTGFGASPPCCGLKPRCHPTQSAGHIFAHISGCSLGNVIRAHRKQNHDTTISALSWLYHFQLHTSVCGERLRACFCMRHFEPDA